MIPPEVPPLSILFHAEGFEELPECSLASGATGEASSGPPVGKQTQQWTSENVPRLNDLKLKHVIQMTKQYSMIFYAVFFLALPRSIIRDGIGCYTEALGDWLQTSGPRNNGYP